MNKMGGKPWQGPIRVCGGIAGGGGDTYFQAENLRGWEGGCINPI